jgi:ribonucleotide reductase alpha subunit
MNIIGHIIVAGNVRRSAMLAIGDPDDVEYLLAKNWSFGNIPSWRAMSNNSVACTNIDDLHEFFWKGYEGNGEPYGLINLELSRACGRLGETQYPDPLVQGYNPCAEQSLEPYESCCLATIFLPNVESKDELIDIATLLYRFNKHSLQLSSHQPETDEVVKRNQRMGVNISGYLQASKEQKSWLYECYEHLRAYDERYSKLHGFNVSIKLTTVQPSGTLSLLPGVTPGAHPGYAQYMYRRIRVAADSHVVNVCRQHGYPIEFVKNFDGSDDYGTVVVTFPFSYPEGTRLAKEMSALDQLEVVKELQTVWSDNAVSCTIYYKKDELPAIKSYLAKNYRQYHKTLSFLLHSDHGFKQAPFEEVSKESYERLRDSVTPITSIGAAEFEAQDECAGGVCPVR